MISQNEFNKLEYKDGDIVVTDIPLDLECGFWKSVSILPDISEIKVNSNTDNIVVIMKFSDGTSEKAICRGDDVDYFSIEMGISICLTKKLLDMQVKGAGSSLYNRLVRHGVKIYNDGLKRAEREEADRKKQKEIQQRKREKHQAWVEECRKKENARMVDVYEEAIKRVLKWIEERGG